MLVSETTDTQRALDAWYRILLHVTDVAVLVAGEDATPDEHERAKALLEEASQRAERTAGAATMKAFLREKLAAARVASPTHQEQFINSLSAIYKQSLHDILDIVETRLDTAALVELAGNLERLATKHGEITAEQRTEDVRAHLASMGMLGGQGADAIIRDQVHLAAIKFDRIARDRGSS